MQLFQVCCLSFNLQTILAYWDQTHFFLSRAWLRCPDLCFSMPSSPQLLYTLTFWLLVRQFVKEKLLKKKPPSGPLLEVTVIEAGEYRGSEDTGWEADPVKNNTYLIFKNLTLVGLKALPHPFYLLNGYPAAFLHLWEFYWWPLANPTVGLAMNSVQMICKPCLNLRWRAGLVFRTMPTYL